MKEDVRRNTIVIQYRNHGSTYVHTPHCTKVNSYSRFDLEPTSHLKHILDSDLLHSLDISIPLLHTREVLGELSICPKFFVRKDIPQRFIK